MACNLPVVSVDVGDVVERLEGVSPSRVAERSPGALARCIAEVLQEDRRSNGRDKISPLSEKLVAQQILEVYRQAIRHSQDVNVLGNQPSASGPTRSR
jgi:glycosyltransferase involved in cell wall biosynthesis